MIIIYRIYFKLRIIHDYEFWIVRQVREFYDSILLCKNFIVFKSVYSNQFLFLEKKKNVPWFLLKLTIITRASSCRHLHSLLNVTGKCIPSLHKLMRCLK